MKTKASSKVQSSVPVQHSHSTDSATQTKPATTAPAADRPDTRLPIDHDQRALNRKLNTSALIGLLRDIHPDLYKRATIVGNWVWLSFANAPEPTTRQQIAQLGDHTTCGGDEYYLNGSTWVCGEPDHWSRPKVMGICFGRCGGGCGGDTQYTLDATNHDGCVRNGHALASAYCDDQFVSASDDEMFAGNCY